MSTARHSEETGIQERRDITYIRTYARLYVCW